LHNKTFYILLSVLLTIFIFSGCSENKKKDKKIARVFDKYLYESDIQNIFPEGISEKDSMQLITNYIDNWIRKQLIYYQADKNLSKKLKNFDKEMEEYKSSMIIYTYEKELIKQKLDTVVTDKEISEYYDNNPGNFQLKDNIVKVVYVKLPINSAAIPSVRSLYKSDNPSDKKELAGFCQKYAVNSSLDDDIWYVFSDILKEIPIKTYNEEDYLKNHKYIEMSDSLYYYFVKICGFKVKESTSPLSMERENIRNIIINKRKLKLINDMHQDIYIKAQTNQDFEKY